MPMTSVEVYLSSAVAIIGAFWVVLSLTAHIAYGRLTDGIAANERALSERKRESDERLAVLNSDSKETRERLERRLSDIEKNYVSRMELAAAIAEFGTRAERSADRIEASLKVLTEEVKALTARVGKVESQ